MFAQVEVFIPKETKVLAVPSKSVLKDEKRAFVFVHHEGDYWVRRPVIPGRTFASQTEINKGLSRGEIVVANGAFLWFFREMA
jgi:cobalt-zinc-cadmium efflux system membrane fusion protein